MLFLLFGFVSSSSAQHAGTIDPSWVYTTPLQWKRLGGAPRNVETRYAAASVVVLYPEGEYLEVTGNLYREGKQPARLPGNDGLLIRTGSWTRTDEHVIRITSREAFEDKVLRKVGEGEPTLPGPVIIDTCALQQTSKQRIALFIQCRRILLTIPKEPIDLSSLAERAREGFAASK